MDLPVPGGINRKWSARRTLRGRTCRSAVRRSCIIGQAPFAEEWIAGAYPARIAATVEAGVRTFAHAPAGVHAACGSRRTTKRVARRRGQGAAGEDALGIEGRVYEVGGGGPAASERVIAESPGVAEGLEIAAAAFEHARQMQSSGSWRTPRLPSIVPRSGVATIRPEGSMR